MCVCNGTQRYTVVSMNPNKLFILNKEINLRCTIRVFSYSIWRFVSIRLFSRCVLPHSNIFSICQLYRVVVLCAQQSVDRFVWILIEWKCAWLHTRTKTQTVKCNRCIERSSPTNATKYSIHKSLVETMETNVNGEATKWDRASEWRKKRCENQWLK